MVDCWPGGLPLPPFPSCTRADYEFIDTAILIVKRKPVSLLQAYHHSGAVIAMWLLAVSQARRHPPKLSMAALDVERLSTLLMITVAAFDAVRSPTARSSSCA